MAPAHSSQKSWFHRILAILGLVLLAILTTEIFYVGSALMGNSFLQHTNPKTTAFMSLERLQRWRGNDYQWVALPNISKALIRAVLVAEDDAFFEHEGIDVDEMKKSWRVNLKRKKIVRGGSTLTMQLVKNLYLSPAKNPFRKLNEIILAYDLEHKLTKARILELYLNVAQWGEGIFGAEAASRHYFKKSAADLTRGEAAYLAAILPNPVYLTGKGSKRAQWRKNMILRRMKRRTLPREITSYRPLP